MPADSQDRAVISFVACLSDSYAEQGKDGRDSSVGVPMEITIHSCAEAVLACRFPHGETAV